MRPALSHNSPFSLMTPNLHALYRNLIKPRKNCRWYFLEWQVVVVAPRHNKCGGCAMLAAVLLTNYTNHIHNRTVALNSCQACNHTLCVILLVIQKRGPFKESNVQWCLNLEYSDLVNWRDLFHHFCRHAGDKNSQIISLEWFHLVNCCI